MLVHFGEPIEAAKFLEGYDARRKECITELSGEIERRLQSLIVHLPGLEHARVVEAVKRLYLERLKLGNIIVKEPLTPRAEDLVLTQAIANAAEWMERTFPERFNAFARKLRDYERRLARLKLPEETSERLSEKRNLLAYGLSRSLLAVLGAPIAVYGWVHRLLPFALIRLVATRFTNPGARKAQTPHASMLVGAFAFGGCYALYVWLVYRWFGWPFSLWYALSLPIAGLISYYYTREMLRLCDALRTAVILIRVPFASRRLLSLRLELLAEIEEARKEYRRTAHFTETA